MKRIQAFLSFAMMILIPFSASGSTIIVPRTEKELKNARYQPPSPPGCVREVRQTIVVNGVFDGGGCLFTWRGEGYPKYCRAMMSPEGLPPMFYLKPGATLRNLQLQCALDGIHTTENNLIENIINRDVEEDAITIGKNITIRNSRFYFCQDKCLQMNSASNVRIENNSFFHSSSPILANFGTKIKVLNNRFYHVRTAVRARMRNGVKSSIEAADNQVKQANCGFQETNGGRIKDKGGNTFKNVDKKECS
ncbi:MAG: hypothetical protein RJB38_454 [Pseudomonadota bacterium]|jgi:hypothetical protein